jgi:hypothetical protein
VKKIILTIGIILMSASIAFSAERPKLTLGVSGTLGALDAKGSETNTNSVTVSKSKELGYGYASIFAEVNLGPFLRIGADYLPSGIATETTENVRAADNAAKRGTNKVQVDINNIMSYYVSAYLPGPLEGFFLRAGTTEGDIVTNEVLFTGSNYANATLKGDFYGVGYERNLDNGIFVRGMVAESEFDSITIAATGGETNSITVSNMSGMSGTISVGKSF